MDGFLFLLGTIWLLMSAGSLLLGPFVGFDRENVKAELIEFYKKMPANYF